MFIAVYSTEELFQTKPLCRGSYPNPRASKYPAQIPQGCCKAMATRGATRGTTKDTSSHLAGLRDACPNPLNKCSIGRLGCHSYFFKQELLMKCVTARKEAGDGLHFIFIPSASSVSIFTPMKEQLLLISLLNPGPGMATSQELWVLSLTGQRDSDASYYPTAAMCGISCGSFLLLI